MEDGGENTLPEKKSFALSAEKVTIGAIVSFLFLLFGAIVVFSAQYGDKVAVNASPTPAPDGLFQAGAQSNLNAAQQQVQGAQNQQPVVIPKPEITPEPTKTPKPTPDPTESPSPSPSPSPSSSTDTEGPKISGISAEDVGVNKATIKFNLSEEGEAKIEYGTDTSYGKTKEVSEKKSSHSIEIDGLDANKTYNYRIIAKDKEGNSTTSGNNEFTTKP